MTAGGPARRAGGKHVLWGAAGGLLVVAVVTAVLAADPRSGTSQTLGDLAILAASLTATVSCARAAARGGPEARAWRWIAAATLIWSLGMVVWAFYGITRNHAYPFPSLADVGFLGYSVPAVVGLLAFPRPQTASAVGVRTLLDTAVIASALAFVSWAAVLGPVAHAEDEDPLHHATILAFPAVDIVVASSVLVLAMRHSPEQRLLQLCLGSGFLVLAVTDSIYVRLTYEEFTGTTGTPLAAGWMSAFLLIALSAAVPGRAAPQKDRTGYAVAMDLLPYLPVLAAVVIANSGLVSEHESFLLPTGLLVLALVAARQVLIVFENVTLTRDLEETVARRTAELRGLAAIVRSSPDAVVGSSTDGSVTIWNPGAERLFGYRAEEAIGRHVSFLLPEDETTAAKEHMAAARERGEQRAFEAHRLRQDGLLVPVAMTVFPVHGEHGTLGIGAIAQDITERRRTEAELLAAREAALESSRVKSEFLATMSHEIRTPMNGVVGLTALLLQTPLDESQRQYAEGVRNAGEALLNLINDILDFSKLEAGKVELRPAPFDPRRLVDDVVGLLAEQARAKDLELVGHCDPAVPACLVGDSRALRQVLLNLASNAVKFTGTGEVAVLATVEDRTEDRSDDRTMLHVEVRDTGIGISPADQEMVFESFAQADASTTRRYGGTGLGLSISRRLVEALGGRIGVRSTPGEGSVFWFSVPLTAADAGPAPDPQGLPAGLRVLVVDDNATNRLVLETQLRAWRLQTRTAADAHQALALLRSAAAEGRPFDVAVLDLCMPGMNGIDLARSIGGTDSLAGTAVLVLTSAGQPDTAEFSAAGVREWLSKPVRSSDLYDRLVQLVAGAPTASAAASAPSAPGEVAGPGGRGADRGRLLVVEDNEVNQLVARSMAERLGYDVDVVTDGAQAVDATQETEYAAVLMDCHMPVMDGFAATGAIRARGGRDEKLPIIAMTAGALVEDRTRCLDAGMDDYLAKPVDMAGLDSVLSRWTRGSARGTAPAEAPAGGDPRPAHAAARAPALDPDRIETLRSLGDDVLKATAEAFLRESASGLHTLHRAGREGGEPLEKAAHKLKGSTANIGATRAAEMCQELEDHGRTHTDVGPHLLPELETELDRVRESLDRILSATPRQPDRSPRS